MKNQIVSERLINDRFQRKPRRQKKITMKKTGPEVEFIDDGWMDGWNGWNGWMDGWMMDGWMEWMDEWMDG